MDSTSTFTIVSFILSITATIISIIVGASQIWHNKVRIDIVFRRGIVAYDIQDMRKSVFVDIVNKSRFPVSIEQIYFELENKNQYRVMDMLLTTGGHLPARLDAMSSLSAAMSADIMSDLKSNNAQYAVVATGNQKVYKSKKLNL